MFNRDLSKGSAELLVLTLLEARPRHGYDLGKLIEERSKGQIRFRIGSLPSGRKFLKAQRSAWDEFVATINQIVRPSHA